MTFMLQSYCKVMGGKSSKHGRSGRSSSSRSNSQQWSRYNYPPSPYAQPTSTPQYQYAPPTPGYGEIQAPETRKRLERKYSRIDDNYNSIDQVLLQFTLQNLIDSTYFNMEIISVSLVSSQVTEALARAGLESSNLIVGIDFTKSNEWTGSSLLWPLNVMISLRFTSMCTC